MSERWNVVIAEQVRHEHQIFSTSAIERLVANKRDVRDVELLVIIFWRREWDSRAK
jgi:hypothetical protein